MLIVRLSPALVAAGLLLSGPAVAQTAAPTAGHTATASKASTSATKAPVVRTAKSLECSKQADTKGLHGKPRKSFMSSCKKA